MPTTAPTDDPIQRLREQFADVADDEKLYVRNVSEGRWLSGADLRAILDDAQRWRERAQNDHPDNQALDSLLSQFETAKEYDSFDMLSFTPEEVETLMVCLRGGKLLPCGHPVSLLVRSVESAHTFCQLCEARAQLRDALDAQRQRARTCRDCVCGHCDEAHIYSEIEEEWFCEGENENCECEMFRPATEPAAARDGGCIDCRHPWDVHDAVQSAADPNVSCLMCGADDKGQHRHPSEVEVLA